MLAALRRSLESWVAKALFILLIASFAIWGVGDFVRDSGTATSVATVAGQRIPLSEATEAYQRQMADLTRRFGGRFEPTPAIRQSIAADAISRTITLRALSAEVTARGVMVSDDALRQAVAAEQGFHGADGRFSRVMFDAFLRNNGLTEPRFLNLLRQDLGRQQVIDSLRDGLTVPAGLTLPIFAFRNETRALEVVELPFIAAAGPEAPTEEQLRRFYDNNLDRFTAPEYRAVSTLVLSLEDVARDVTIQDQAVREAYEARRESFSVPERRTIEQALVPDEAVARALGEAWAGGLSFAQVTEQARAAGGAAIPLGSVTRAEVPLPELADAAFDAAEGAVAGPVRSPFGWHVLKVTAIAPGSQQGFDEVAVALRAELARERAGETIYAVANRVEDDLAGGLPLADVARRHGLTLRQIEATDRQGLDRGGQPVDTAPIGQRLVDAVFAAGQGAPARLAEAEGANFFAVIVTRIDPAAARAYDSVAGAVRDAWEAGERRRAIETQAAGLLAAVRGGRLLGDAAREAGWSPRRLAAFTRTARGAGAPPPQLVQAAFALAANEATMIESATGFIVAQVAEINAAPADPSEDATRELRAELATGMADDIESQFLDAVRRQTSVTLNPRATSLIVGTTE